jgi:hypothetical protein
MEKRIGCWTIISLFFLFLIIGKIFGFVTLSWLWVIFLPVILVGGVLILGIILLLIVIFFFEK